MKKKTNPTFGDILDMECCSADAGDRLETLQRLIKEDFRFDYFTKEQKEILDLFVTIVGEVRSEAEENTNIILNKLSNLRVTVRASCDDY